jgi:PRTRC genetic system ThiF family protein
MNRFTIPERFLEQPVRIVVVGAGGTGSQLCDQLASLEVSLRALGHPGFEVTVHDRARVTRAAIGRQRFTAADVGLVKSTILVHRIRAFYGLDWHAVPRAHDPRGPTGDLLITCVDLARYRAELGRYHHKRRSTTLWLDAGNDASNGQVVLGHLGDPGEAVRLPNVYDLYPELARMEAEDRAAPSCSAEESLSRQSWPVNRVAAQLMTELLWTLFRKGSITHHGAQFALDPLRTTPLPIDPATWAFYGYGAGAAKRQRPRAIAA